MNDPIPAEFIEAVGEEDAQDMRDTMQAVAHLLTLQAAYSLSPTGSQLEHQAEEAVERILTGLLANPEKCGDVLTCLLSLVVSMRIGEPYLAFFATAGINATPLVNPRTGEKV